MGEFLERVSARARNPEAVAHRVALFLSNEDRRAVIVEAGDDAFFYGSLFRRMGRSQNRIEFFQDNGRDLVIRSLDILIQMKKRHAFSIIDRDFDFYRDSLTHNGHCLTTRFHSAESYVAEERPLFEIGKSLFALEVGSESLTSWSQACSRFSTGIGSLLRDEHAVAAASYREARVCLLANFRVKDHISVDEEGGLSLKLGSYEQFLRITGCKIDKDFDRTVKDVRSDLDKMDWRMWFRGHYFWSVFVSFLNSFRNKLDIDNKNKNRNRSRTRADLTERHVYEVGAAFVPIPGEIESYFRAIDA